MTAEVSAAVAAWSQVAATLIVGLGAVFVAWFQLRRYNDNERIASTLKILDDYYRSHTIDVGTTEPHASPATAIRSLVNVSRNESALGAYFEQYEDDAGNLVPSAFFVEMWQNLNIANDYLFTVHQLLRRNLIDRQLALISLCKVVQEAVNAIQLFQPNLNLHYLREFSAEAKGFEAGLPPARRDRDDAPEG